jgi:hypothetical protein
MEQNHQADGDETKAVNFWDEAARGRHAGKAVQESTDSVPSGAKLERAFPVGRTT